MSGCDDCGRPPGARCCFDPDPRDFEPVDLNAQTLGTLRAMYEKGKAWNAARGERCISFETWLAINAPRHARRERQAS